jgi:pilus assembly protein CpaE
MAQDLTKLLALMRRVYNIVIVDTATSLTEVNLALLDGADLIVMVLAYEESALRQSWATMATFARIGYPPDKVRFLLNRSKSPGGLRPDAVDAVIGRRPDFTVVSDGQLVLAANNRGEQFVLVSPDAEISRDVARVAAGVSAPDLVAAAVG